MVVDDADDDDEVLGLFSADMPGNKGSEPITIQASVLLVQQICGMQLDTRVTVSILPKTC